MLPRLTSNMPMLVFQETSCDAIYAASRCLTISCPSLKACIMHINIRCWMGIFRIYNFCGGMYTSLKSTIVMAHDQSNNVQEHLDSMLD